MNQFGTGEQRTGFVRFHLFHQTFQISIECRPDFRVTLAENHGRLQVTELGTTVVAGAVITISQDLLFAEQRGDAVSQLDFATGTGLTFSR